MSTVISGHCPVCRQDTEFRSADGWFRDNLRCAACDSIPRERAFAWALDRFRPNWRDLCLKEMARTLRPGGAAIFTTPLYAERATTARRAIRFADGDEHLAPPEYHGNPVDEAGALVTFHYGQNFSDLMRAWAPDLSLLRLDLNDPRIGVIGAFRDVFIAAKGAI